MRRTEDDVQTAAQSALPPLLDKAGMESKSIVGARRAVPVLWANLATALVAIAAVNDMDLSAEEAAVGVAGIFTVVNVVMRLITARPAHLMPPQATNGAKEGKG